MVAKFSSVVRTPGPVMEVRMGEVAAAVGAGVAAAADAVGTAAVAVGGFVADAAGGIVAAVGDGISAIGSGLGLSDAAGTVAGGMADIGFGPGVTGFAADGSAIGAGAFDPAFVAGLSDGVGGAGSLSGGAAANFGSAANMTAGSGWGNAGQLSSNQLANAAYGGSAPSGMSGTSSALLSNLGSSAIKGIGGMVASQTASQQQQAAQQQAISQMQNTYGQNAVNIGPWITGGNNALSALQSGFGMNGASSAPLLQPFTAAQYQQSPGYAFQMQQGQDAIMNNASRTGGVDSGNTLKALDQYSQGLANQNYQQAQQNYTANQTQQYNMLAGLSTQGLAGANALNNVQTNLTGNIANAQVGMGNAQAAGTVGSYNALSSGLGGAANSLGAYLYNQGTV